MFNREVKTILLFTMLSMVMWQCASEQLTSARLYIKQENWEKAEEMLQAARAAEPENPEIDFLLGKDVYARKGMWEEMNDALNSAVSKGGEKRLSSGKTVKEEVEITRVSLWSEYYNKAADLYNLAIKGEVDQREQIMRHALENFYLAKRIYPDEPKTYRNLLFCHIQLHEDEQVAELLTESLIRNPDDITLLVTASDLATKNGEKEKAIEYLLRAVSVDRSNVQVIRLLADAYYDIGDKESAVLQYKRALAEDSENADLHFNLGVLYLQLEDYDLAEEKFQTVLRLNPNDLEAVMGMGESYERLGRWEDAEYYYSKALAIEPNNANLLKGLARVVLHQGRQEEAMEYFNKSKSFE